MKPAQYICAALGESIAFALKPETIWLCCTPGRAGGFWARPTTAINTTKPNIFFIGLCLVFCGPLRVLRGSLDRRTTPSFDLRQRVEAYRAFWLVTKGDTR